MLKFYIILLSKNKTLFLSRVKKVFFVHFITYEITN